MEENRDDREAVEDGEMGEETVVEILGFGADDDPPESEAKDPGGDGDREAALARDLATERDRYLRLRADFDNFRKRAERERAEVERYALVEPARQLLPVVDNFERALASASGSGDELRRGVEMIHRQMLELLKRLGVQAVPALGERFDPSLHEAVQQTESADVVAPTVVEEYQRGFRLNERLLRPAMVKVALPADGAAGEEDGGATPDAAG